MHWYIVPPSNGTLGFPCRINSLDWRDMRVNPSPVGEVTFAERVYDGWGRIVPPVPGDHLCGTEEDFREGGRYLPELPPFERAADGVPLCCRPELGGVEIGAPSWWDDNPPLPAGGVEIGGAWWAEFLGIYRFYSPGNDALLSRFPPTGLDWYSFGDVFHLNADWTGAGWHWTLTNTSGDTWENIGWDGVPPADFTPVSPPGLAAGEIRVV